MKKIVVEVLVTNRYEIEIDENAINEGWLNDYKENFTNLSTLEEHAENLAIQRTVNVSRSDTFLEGYGRVRIKNGGFDSKEWEKTADGITIKVLSEDEDIDTFIVEQS